MLDCFCFVVAVENYGFWDSCNCHIFKIDFLCKQMTMVQRVGCSKATGFWFYRVWWQKGCTWCNSCSRRYARLGLSCVWCVLLIINCYLVWYWIRLCIYSNSYIPFWSENWEELSFHMYRWYQAHTCQFYYIILLSRHSYNIYYILNSWSIYLQSRIPWFLSSLVSRSGF